MLRKRLHIDSPWLPRLAASLTVLVGAVNIASALTPDIRWRGHLLLQVEAVHTIEFFHALALPAGAALLLVAPYLLKRRRRARQVAFALLVVAGIVNLLKGFDFEEALVGWTVAALLYGGRSQFNVEHEPITLRSAVWRVPLIGGFCVGIVAIADWVDHGRLTSGSNLLGESSALLRFKQGQDHFERESAGAFGHHIHFAWIPLEVHFAEIGALLVIAYVIFRPLAAPKSWPSASVRRLAAEVVREHGQDTLSFFKLRPDKHYYFNDARTAFVAYRVEAGTLLLSGDPVGPAEAFPGLLLQVRSFARSRGLKLAAVGASENLVKIYDALGLQALYIGDEAIVELDKFSLEGRPIRKVRQSVSRLTKAGFTADLHTLATLDRATLPEIERVIELGRQGRPERGFSMAMDSIRGDCEQDTVFVLARDEMGSIRGVLHFVPCYGRP
jgi:lysyl-tRNA synthetase class 2